MLLKVDFKLIISQGMNSAIPKPTISVSFAISSKILAIYAKVKFPIAAGKSSRYGLAGKIERKYLGFNTSRSK